jgi:hypothetical protein
LKVLANAAPYFSDQRQLDGTKPSHPGHTSPFIARLTRACPGFEVKDGAKRRQLRWSSILEFKAGTRFSTAMR